jgi:hypothetical protein
MAIPVEVPLAKHFSKDRISDIEKYLSERLEARKRGLTNMMTEKIKTWRKVYAGTPREKTKSFPWQNASNVVVKLVRSFSDQLAAKIVMGSVAMEPVFVADLVGDFKANQHAEDQREAVQDWMGYNAHEPSRWNLIPKYGIWTRNFVKYGFSAMKLMPERRVEQMIVSEGATGPIFTEFTRYDGPVCLPIMFEDFLMSPTTVELIRDACLFQRARLEKWQVERLRYDRSFDRAAVAEALLRPTRQGPDRNQQDIENESGARSDTDPVNDQWDMYEAHYQYQVMGKTFRCISTLFADDMGQQCTFVKHVFNWLPENSIPYIGAWLAPDGERAYAPGFCELLADYQEETSQIHNRRGDAATAANTSIFRIGSGQQIDSQFSFYPMATFTGDKDSLEVIQLGREARETIKDEQMTLNLAQDLAGVGPSSSGQGAGTVNKKGSYSAMGSFPTLQEGNTRANLITTEFRVSHYTLGRLALLYDAYFGVEQKDRNALGKKGEYLEMALQNVKEGKIALPIRAATGSVNKEIEKQNLMLLFNNVRAHWQFVAQLMQTAENPMAPPQLKDYVMQVVVASNILTRKICKEFAIEDPSSIVPEPRGIKEATEDAERKFEAAKMQRALSAGANGQGTGAPGPAQLPQPQAPGAPGAGSDQPLITQ